MKEPYYHIVLNEHSAVIQSLNDTRNAFLAEEKSTDLLDDLIIKIGNAPYRKIRVIERNSDDAR